jgi:hypothetical protein
MAASRPHLEAMAREIIMPTVSTEDAHQAWIVAERIKRVSDRLVKLGAFSVGLDGLFAWVPGLGTLYSFGAGIWLLVEATKVRASAWTVARMAAYLGLRTLSSIVPLEGWLVDFLFRGHMMAANALQKDIELRFGEPAWEAIDDARRHPFLLFRPPVRPIQTA